MIGALTASAIVQKIGLKATFILGFVLLSLMVFCQILASERAVVLTDDPNSTSLMSKGGFVIPFLFAAQVIAGFGQAIIWVAQGEYNALCATEETKGFFFALFWAMYMGSQIAGNAVGAAIITSSSGPIFFVIMGIIMLASTALFMCLRQPHTFSLMKDVPVEEFHDPFLVTMKNTIKLLCDRKMLFLVP